MAPVSITITSHIRITVSKFAAKPRIRGNSGKDARKIFGFAKKASIFL
jgi:hypothetical protein